MKIPVLESLEDFTNLSGAEKNESPAFVFKHNIAPNDCDQIKTEIVNWAATVPLQDSKRPYPEGVHNVHMRVSHQELVPEEHQASHLATDFHELYTHLDVHNYRIGWLGDPNLVKQTSTFQRVAKKLYQDFCQLTQTQFPLDPSYKKKLHFEFAQYPLGTGFIEKHTHFRSIENGQRWNLLTLLSQDSVDHSSAGLVFEISGKPWDTRKLLDKGDSLLFRLDLPHYVNKVEPATEKAQSAISGRWTLGLFYY